VKKYSILGKRCVDRLNSQFLVWHEEVQSDDGLENILDTTRIFLMIF